MRSITLNSTALPFKTTLFPSHLTSLLQGSKKILTEKDRRGLDEGNEFIDP